MRRKIILLAVAWTMFLGGNNLLGQIHNVMEFPNCLNSDTSIVRNWYDKLNIIYSQSPAGNQIYLTDANSTAVYSIFTDINIKDMEILEDTLYYCGADQNNISYIGQFTIPDMLTSSVSETLVQIPTGGSGNSYPFFPKRMEVFHVSAGIHVVMVCDMVCPSDTIKRVMMDARSHYGNTTWAFNFVAPYTIFDDQSNIFYPDDVAVTDSYVVFIGHKHCSAGIYMKKFQKPNNLTDFYNYTSFSYQNIYNYYLTSGIDYSVLGQHDGEHPVWGVGTIGDTIAIACMSSYNDSPSGFMYGVTVKKIALLPFTSSEDISFDLFFPYTRTLNRLWVVKDIRYDKYNNNILLLYDADSPVSGSTETMAMTINHAHFSNGESFLTIYNKVNTHSMDKFYPSTNRMVTCGTSLSGSGSFLCTHHANASDRCIYDFIPKSIKVKATLPSFNVAQDCPPRQSAETLISTSTKETKVTIVCQ